MATTSYSALPLHLLARRRAALPLRQTISFLSARLLPSRSQRASPPHSSHRRMRSPDLRMDFKLPVNPSTHHNINTGIGRTPRAQSHHLIPPLQPVPTSTDIHSPPSNSESLARSHHSSSMPHRWAGASRRGSPCARNRLHHHRHHDTKKKYHRGHNLRSSSNSSSSSSSSNRKRQGRSLRQGRDNVSVISATPRLYPDSMTSVHGEILLSAIEI